MDSTRESLFRWLELAHETIGGEEGVSREDMLAAVTLHVFDVDGAGAASTAESRQDLVRRLLSSFFGLDEGPWLTTLVAVEACLVVAMSDSNASRPDFVRGIMSMPAEDRTNLMQTIKHNMERFVTPNSMEAEEDSGMNEQADSSCVMFAPRPQLGGGGEGDDEDEDEDMEDCDNSMATIPMNEHGEVEFLEEVEEGEILLDLSSEVPVELTEVKSTGKRAREEQTSDSTYTRAQTSNNCKICVEKDSTLQQLTADLNAALNNAHDIEMRLKSEIASEKNKLVDSELQVLEREEQLSARDQEIRDCRKRIHDLESALHAQTGATQDLSNLQDELDVLRPRAEKADQAEAQIERLRSRLEELLDVKQQLKTESSAHSDTYNRLIAAEKEVSTLHKTRAQLEEYRAQYAESVLQVNDLERRLQQREEDLMRVQQDNQALGATSQGSLLQTQHIMQELRETAEQLRHAERSNGIGEGMSELNPALMQELTRLRKENIDLEGKLDATSLESLTKLEKELADQRCLVSSLQGKLHDTKDALTLALQSIMHLNDKVARLEQQHVNTIREASEASVMATEERNLALILRNKASQNANKREFSAVSLAIQGQQAVTFELSQELFRTSSTLQTTQTELQDVSDRKAQLEAAHSQTLNDLELAHSEKTALVASHHHAMEEINEAHASALSKETDKCRELEADVAEERNKRRKVEREKKYHESEAKSSKSQLLLGGGNGGGASGPEMEAALKELKSMQTALDAATAEIHALRSHVANGGGDDGDGVMQFATSNSSSAASAVGGRSAAAAKPLRVKTNAVETGCGTAVSTANTFTSYFEQTGLVDKRLEQADRERRQLIASSLEESREKMELQQKLLKSEKEVAALKRANTKLTLEKERLLTKSGVTTDETDENNPNSPLPARTRRRTERA